LPPFDRTVIDDNHADRLGDDPGQNPVATTWRAIRIAPARVGASGHFATAYFFNAGETAYLLTANSAFAFAMQPADVSIQGNRLRAHLTDVPLNQCAGVDNCLFAGNRCETVGAGGREPLLGELGARTLNASNNRLIGLGDLDTLHLHPQIEHAIVIGNTSTGNIRVLGGTPVPADIALTNVIGF